MAIDACIAKVTKVLEGELPKKDVAEIATEIRRRADRARRADGALSEQEALNAAAQEVMDEFERAALEVRRRQNIDLVVLTENRSFIAARMEDGLTYQQALQARMVNTEFLVIGGKESAFTRAMALQEINSRIVYVELEQAGVLQQVTDRKGFWGQGEGPLDMEIAREMRAVSADEPSATGIDDARTIAEIFHRAGERSRTQMNRAGAAIGQRWDYIVKQSHDPRLVSKAKFDQWFNDIIDELDHDATFGGADPREFMQAAFDNITGGRHGMIDDAPHEIKFVGSSNLAKSVSQERVLHFKSAEGWFKYNRKYGSRSLIGSVMGGIQHSARTTALMQTFGTNPRMMFDQLVREGPPGIEVEKLETRFNNIDGTTSQVEHITSAHIAEGVQVLQHTSKLGAATLSSFSDPMTVLGDLNWQGMDMPTAIAEFTTELFAGLTSKQAREVAEAMNVGIDGILAHVNRWSAGENFRGGMAEMQRVFYKLNLLTQWTDANKAAMGRVMAHQMSKRLAGSFADLDPKFRRVMQSYGIDEAEWRVLQSVDQNMADGRAYLTGDRIGDLTEAHLQPLIGDTTGRLDAEIDARKARMDAEIERLTVEDPDGDALVRVRNQRRTIEAERARRRRPTVEAARDDLGVKLQSYYSDRADAGVPTPGANERAIFNRGTVRGTPEGILFRAVSTFKMFPTTMITRVIGRDTADIRLNIQRQVHAGGGTVGINPATMSATARALIEGRGDVLMLATHFAMVTVMGVVALNLKEIAKGRSPRDPFGEDAANVWRAALLQGGGLGIFGDFLFGEYNRFGQTLLETTAGPAAGAGFEFGELIFSVLRGDLLDEEERGRTTVKAAKFGLSNTPFINLFYTRAAFDYLVGYQLMEIMNPGSVERMERRVQEENNQTFLIDPTDVID